MTAFSAVQVAENVFWVGAIDWSLREFHGYNTSRGTTYNAYLVMADKITLIDTVKRPFFDEMMARIASVVDPSKIEYIVSNHAEMDHSGSLPEAVRAIQPAKVFASSQGVKALQEHFGPFTELTEVKDTETLSLGNLNLTFFETRMLHWPDSMVSYLAERQLLFSQDAFGMHLASSERFGDELPENILVAEGEKYFANILMPFSPLIKKAVERLTGAGIEIKIIAPDHGPIWREKPEWIIGKYLEWADQKPKKKAVVLYDTMWGSTEKMAQAVAEGLYSVGVVADMLSLSASHRSDVVTSLLDAGALIVGSPTMNNQVYPSLADCMTYLKGLKPKDLIGAAFGSYGWSGESLGLLEKMLDDMKVERVAEGIRVKYIPTEADLTVCRELGAQVGRALLEKCGGNA